MSYLQHQIAQLIQCSKAQESLEPYYEVLEYIQTTGVEYFDTDVILSSTSKVEMGITYTGVPSSGSSYAFGTFGNNKNFGINAALNANPAKWYGVWGSASTLTSATLSPALNTKYDIEMSSSGIYINGTLMSSVSGTFTGAQSVYLMWAHTTSQPKTIGKIHYVKIYDNGTLIKDYVPVLNDRMTPCLYDKVSKTFLYALGNDNNTITFKRWNKFDVDYIQSSGTQYIDTGYAFADDFAYEVEYEGLNNGECLLGGRISSVRTAILYRAMATQVDGQTTVPIAGLNATQTPFKLGVFSDTKHKVKVAIANNKGNVWVDDTQVYTNQSFTGTYISGKTTAIFADHFGDQTGTSEYQEYATSKLYALKFWQGTTLVRDYKPSVRTYNDGTSVVTKAFLYDEVYNKAYDNAGTGSLSARVIDSDGYHYDVGAEIEAPTDDTTWDDKEYIETGIIPDDTTNIELLITKLGDTTMKTQLLFGTFGNSENAGRFNAIQKRAGYNPATYTDNGTEFGFGVGSADIGVNVAQLDNFNFTNNQLYDLMLYNKKLYIDNVLTATLSGDMSTNTLDCYLFKCNDAYNTTAGRGAAPTGIRYCRLWQQDELVREYIPARSIDDTDIIGLFDKVNRTLEEKADGTDDLVFVDLD